jgi:hypothetical protein
VNLSVMRVQSVFSDFYREQGRKQERERIIDLLMQLPVSEATYKLIQSLKGERNA